MFRNRIAIAHLACFALALGISQSVYAEVRYQVTDLGNLGNRSADPWSLNDRGEVVGKASTAPGEPRPFFWSAATGMINILPAGQPGTRPEAWAVGINNLGQVIGVRREDQHAVDRGFLWTAAHGMQDIVVGEHVVSINNAGQVLGGHGGFLVGERAFIWEQTTGIRRIDAHGSLDAINDHAQVAGDDGIAYRWTETGGHELLGTLGGISSQAVAINNRGDVAGNSATADNGGNSVGHAFLYDANGMHDIGHLGGNSTQAFGMNDFGWVVGHSYTTESPPVHAVLYDGALHDLNDLIDPASGWDLRQSRDINNAGQIIALAVRDSEPWAHAVLLTPIPEPMAAMPVLAILLSSSALRTSRIRRCPSST